MSFVNRFVAGVGAGARTLILLHGTGGDETSLLELGPMLDPDANLLGIRGKSTEEGVNRFFRRHGEGVFDEADLIAQAGDLAIFLNDARESFGLSDEITLVGHSNGANMAAALMLLHPEVADSAILFRAMVPLQPSSPPDLSAKRVFLSSGEHDPMAPIQSARNLSAMFAQYGASVEHQVAPIGHQLRRDDIAAAAAWLAR